MSGPSAMPDETDQVEIAVEQFLFFSFSQSKLPGYILPAIPPLVLLIAVGVQRRILISPVPSGRCVLIAVGITWIVMALSAVHWISRLPAAARDVPEKMILQVSIIAISGGIAIVVLGFRRGREALLLSFFLAALCVELAGARVCPERPVAHDSMHDLFLGRLVA